MDVVIGNGGMELDIMEGTINGWMNEMKRNGMRRMDEWMCDIGIMAWYAGYLKIYSLFTAECSRNGIRKCIKKREEK